MIVLLFHSDPVKLPGPFPHLVQSLELGANSRDLSSSLPLEKYTLVPVEGGLLRLQIESDSEGTVVIRKVLFC